MLAEQAPDCVCGKHNFKFGGGSMGGRVATTSFTCPDCQRTIWILENRDASVALIDTNADILAGLSMENYANDILIPAMEAGLKYPPGLPNNITALVGNKGSWFKVEHKVSQAIPIPPDANKIKHEEYWRSLIAKLNLNKPVKEVKNQYYDDRKNVEPWYELKVNQDTTITFGIRKRVISIKVSRWIDGPNRSAVSFKNIETLAKADNVTFDNNSTSGIQKLEVHAWGQDKFVEYFKCIMNELGHDLG